MATAPARTLFNKDVVLNATSAAFEIRPGHDNSELVINVHAAPWKGTVSLLREEADKSTVVATFDAPGRQQLRLPTGKYVVAPIEWHGGYIKLNIREISPPQPGVHFGSADGKPVKGRRYVGR
jgi:hypothetical protein